MQSLLNSQIIFGPISAAVKGQASKKPPTLPLLFPYPNVGPGNFNRKRRAS
ncbi:MAG: hypothetical protein NVS9B4_07210 [Candidatus Acidiferrum sp.]